MLTFRIFYFFDSIISSISFDLCVDFATPVKRAMGAATDNTFQVKHISVAFVEKVF